LKDIVTVAAVDADAHTSLGQQYSIQGFPTIKAMTYKDGKIKAVDYKGGRSPQDIIQWALGQAQRVALGRLGVKASSAGAGAGSGRGRGSSSGGDDSFYAGTSVEELDDSNFHSKVTDSDEIWFVEFYAPWCGHCKALKSAWIELAAGVEGRVRVGAVDCTASQQTCQEFGIGGFPTIKLFGSDKSRPEDYEGGRDSGSLTAFALEKWGREQPPPEVRELTDQEVLTEHCLGHPGDDKLGLKEKKPAQLCLVAFLPHILDSGVAGRNAFLETLAQVAAAYKERPFSWFWAEGGAQTGLEANVGVGGYGFPAFVAYSPSKQKYASLRSAFGGTALREFLDGVRTGRERVVELEGELATLEERAPWDGSEGQEMVEEEFSLEDLGLAIEENEAKDEL
jgi:protein disulfide-isomerase A6